MYLSVSLSVFPSLLPSISCLSLKIYILHRKKKQHISISEVKLKIKLVKKKLEDETFNIIFH